MRQSYGGSKASRQDASPPRSDHVQRTHASSGISGYVLAETSVGRAACQRMVLTVPPLSHCLTYSRPWIIELADSFRAASQGMETEFMLFTRFGKV
jgi:hypothetical protein